jgi:hypothetical protein
MYHGTITHQPNLPCRLVKGSMPQVDHLRPESILVPAGTDKLKDIGRPKGAPITLPVSSSSEGGGARMAPEVSACVDEWVAWAAEVAPSPPKEQQAAASGAKTSPASLLPSNASTLPGDSVVTSTTRVVIDPRYAEDGACVEQWGGLHMRCQCSVNDKVRKMILSAKILKLLHVV